MGTFQTISGVLTVCSVARGLRNIMIMRFKADNVCTLHFQRGHILANKKPYTDQLMCVEKFISDCMNIGKLRKHFCDSVTHTKCNKCLALSYIYQLGCQLAITNFIQATDMTYWVNIFIKNKIHKRRAVQIQKISLAEAATLSSPL